MNSLFTDLEKNMPKLSSKPSTSNANNSTATKKRKFSSMEWIVYSCIFLFICGISSGVGVATYNVAHSPQNVLFQVQFNSATTQLQNSIQAGLKQKFAGSSLLGKMFSYAAKYGYGTTYGQVPPFFTLPGFQDYATDIITLGVFRNINWYPLVGTTMAKYPHYTYSVATNLPLSSFVSSPHPYSTYPTTHLTKLTLIIIPPPP